MEQIEDKERKEREDKRKKELEVARKKEAKRLAIRKARITKEYNRLVKLYVVENDINSHVIKKLCARASFLLILAEDIEKDINSDNLTVLTINASQQFTKSNPLLKDYRDTVKSYQTVVKQLCDLSKPGTQITSNDKSGPDELEMFMNT